MACAVWLLSPVFNLQFSKLFNLSFWINCLLTAAESVPPAAPFFKVNARSVPFFAFAAHILNEGILSLFSAVNNVTQWGVAVTFADGPPVRISHCIFSIFFKSYIIHTMYKILDVHTLIRRQTKHFFSPINHSIFCDLSVLWSLLLQPNENIPGIHLPSSTFRLPRCP